MGEHFDEKFPRFLGVVLRILEDKVDDRFGVPLVGSHDGEWDEGSIREEWDVGFRGTRRGSTRS
jgi:hypothetical protein